MTSAFVVGEHPSGASAPRQHASRLAQSLGFDDTRAGQVALVVSELATNIAKHAESGQILIREVVHNDGRGIEVLAADKGPGIPSRAMSDGYSTTGSLGSGLGAIRRQADDFDIYTQPHVGTIAVVRFWSDARGGRGPLSVAGISTARPGEPVCGDAWAMRADAIRRVVVVADGLGHGPHAAEAADTAMHVFAGSYALDPARLMNEIHVALRPTRGAAVAISSFDVERRVLRFAGVGNIGAALVGSDSRRHNLSSHNGTAGHAMRRVQEFAVPVPSGGVLVMHSDGLTTHWNPENYPGVWERDAALPAGALYRDHTRGRDDATVVVVRL